MVNVNNSHWEYTVRMKLKIFTPEFCRPCVWALIHPMNPKYCVQVGLFYVLLYMIFYSFFSQLIFSVPWFFVKHISWIVLIWMDLLSVGLVAQFTNSLYYPILGRISWIESHEPHFSLKIRWNERFWVNLGEKEYIQWNLIWNFIYSSFGLAWCWIFLIINSTV